ncbi:MAG: hypothetical protein ACP5P4_16185 [Steroidobacteraceae bacterium]
MLLTVAAINAAGSTPAAKLAAALTAQSVATIFADAASGNATAISAEISTLVGSISDPGLALVAKQLAATGTPYLQAFLSAKAAMPLLGLTEQAILSSVAAGMEQAAQAYITAYGKTS